MYLTLCYEVKVMKLTSTFNNIYNWFMVTEIIDAFYHCINNYGIVCCR